MQAAISATATATRLQTLSLARLTLPRSAPGCVTALSSLTARTALNASNTCISGAAVTALCAVLPHMPRLTALDLSDNVIDDATMPSLMAAVRQCPSLEHLNLLKTMPASDGFRALTVLAKSITCLAGLSCLSLGGRGWTERTGADMDGDSAPAVFLRGACNLTCLRELTMDFAACEHLHNAPGMARSLAALTQLASLHFTVASPVDRVALDMMPGMGNLATLDMIPRVWAHLAQGVASLTQLTQLELCFDRKDKQTRRRPWLLAIAQLTSLRCLSVRGLGFVDGEPGILAASLRRLECLTSLQIHDDCMDSPPMAALVAAACALPTLRRLHLPFSSEDGACRQALLRATHLERLPWTCTW